MRPFRWAADERAVSSGELSGGHAPDGKEMSAQGDSITIGFKHAGHRKKSIAIVGVIPQFGPKPARALDSKNPNHVQASIDEFVLQFIRTMKKRRGEPSGLLMGVAMLTFSNVSFHDRPKFVVENEAKPNTVKYRCQSGDPGSYDDPARADDPLCLS